MSRAQFIAAATAELPKAPAYFGYDAEINKRDHELLEVSLKRSLKGLSLEALLELQHKGALVLDVRDPAEYEPAHLAGSLNIGLGGKYATWAGTLLDPARPIVLIAAVLREQEAAMRLGRIGFDHVVGFLSGGPAAFLGRKELVRSIERVEPLAMLQRLTSKERELVLDVRGANEWADYRIEGSLNIPLPELERRIAEVPHGKRIAVHCLSGYRSSIAGGILERHGFSGFTDLVGGISAWRVAGLPTSTSAATAR